MKIFIKNIFFYFLLLFSIIGLFYLINGFIIKNYELLNIKKSKNILIVGASRTANAINDNYLDSSINLSGAGDPLFYSLIKLRTFKNNNLNIDTVLLSLDSRTLNSKIANRFYRPISLESKLPNYYNLLEISDLKQLLKIDIYSTFKAMFYIPKYSLKLIKNIFKPDNNFNLNVGGYIKVKHIINQNVIDDFIKNDSIKNYTLSNIEIENLDRIVEFSKINKVELIFINPPIHSIMYKSKEYQTDKIIFDKYLSENYSTNTYLDYSNQFLPDSCYADLIHLNENGAKLFSKKLDSLLKIPK